jgi:hypothetical protein
MELFHTFLSPISRPSATLPCDASDISVVAANLGGKARRTSGFRPIDAARDPRYPPAMIHIKLKGFDKVKKVDGVAEEDLHMDQLVIKSKDDPTKILARFDIRAVEHYWPEEDD